MRLALAAIALIVAAPVKADVLVDNVDGLTLAADGTVQRFSGLLIDNNGRIQQLFQRSDKRPASADYRLDGKGRVELVDLNGHAVGRGTFEPGWRWSSHVKPIVGTPLCEAPHFQYQVAGSLLIDRFLPPTWAAQTFAHGASLDASSQEYWRQGIQLLGNKPSAEHTVSASSKT